MKYFCLILSVVLCYLNTNAQCMVDAGVDKVICTSGSSFPTDTTRLQASVVNNVGSYQVKWSTTIATGLISLPYIYASDMLSDTTILNPIINKDVYISNNVPIIFKIEIIDSMGNLCEDSSIVKFSNFGVSMYEYKVHQVAGDTFEIFAGVLGGIPPVHFEWYPKENIDTLSFKTCCTHVWPVSNTTYSAVVTDDAGCTVGVSPVWNFFISNSVNNLTKNELKIYPNPTNGRINFTFEKQVAAYITLSNALGQVVLFQKPIQDQLDLGHLPKGKYFFKVNSSKEILSTGSILIE